MLRALNLTLPFAEGRMTRRRHRRFAPSLAGSTSCLEDRVMLSALNGEVAQAVHPLPVPQPGGNFGPILHPPSPPAPGLPPAPAVHKK
jgi:hypothetical protein